MPDPGFDSTRGKKTDALTYFPDRMSRDWLTLTERGIPRDTATTMAHGRCTAILNPYYLDYPNTYYSFNNSLVRKITPRSTPSCAILTNMYGYYKASYLFPDRPYIMTKLKSSLKRNHFYYEEYYVKATCNHVYVSNIDLLFSVFEPGPYYCVDNINWPIAKKCEDSLRYYPAIPQIKNPAGRFITDSTHWTRICGVYQAQGEEQYITIGNFAHDRDTDTIPGDKRKSWGGDWYLVDDVTVTELDFPSDTTVCNNQFPFTLSPSSSYADYFSYTQSPGTNFVINAPGLYEYAIANEACSAKATVKVNIEQPLAFDVKDTSVCSKDVPVLFISPMINRPNTWYNGSKAKSIRISDAGKYWLELENACGNKADTFELKLHYPPQIVTPDTSVLLCKDDTLAQEQTIHAIVNDYDYLQWSTGEASNDIHLTQPGIYTLTTNNECGESKMTLTAHGCPPDSKYELFVPNLVTPNGDDKNDFWEIRYKNIVITNIEIMNSWGSRIFMSDDSTINWQPTEDGLYFYLVEYIKPVTNERAVEKGWVQVIK